MAKKRNRLADTLKVAANDPANRNDWRRRTWFSRLEPDEQQELLEVRECFRSGGYPVHCSAQWVYNQIRNNGANVPSYDTFRRWLYRGE